MQPWAALAQRIWQVAHSPRCRHLAPPLHYCLRPGLVYPGLLLSLRCLGQTVQMLPTLLLLLLLPLLVLLLAQLVLQGLLGLNLELNRHRLAE